MTFPEISAAVLERVCQYFYYKLRYQNTYARSKTYHAAYRRSVPSAKQQSMRTGPPSRFLTFRSLRTRHLCCSRQPTTWTHEIPLFHCSSCHVLTGLVPRWDPNPVRASGVRGVQHRCTALLLSQVNYSLCRGLNKQVIHFLAFVCCCLYNMAAIRQAAAFPLGPSHYFLASRG